MTVLPIKKAFARAAAKHPAADLKTILDDDEFRTAMLDVAVTYVDETRFLVGDRVVNVATSGPAERRHRVLSTTPCPGCGAHFVGNDACDLCGGNRF